MLKNRPMSTSQQIMWWGKYAFGIVVVISLVAVYQEFTSNITVRRSVDPNVLKESPTSLSRNHILQAYSLRHVQEADCSHMDTLRVQVAKAKLSIWNDWNVSHYPLFLNMLHIPQRSWDVQKAKFIKLLLEAQSGELAQKEFVAGFSGSSVTAGHDNIFDDAYPGAFYRRLSPVFSNVGVKLVVRNMAIGNNPCYPYDACIATHLGDDLDILTWEQSMNCGRNCKPLDTFTRAASFMKKKPTVVYFLSGGPTWSLTDCIRLNLADEPQMFMRPAFSREEKALLRQSLKKTARNSLHMFEMQFLKDDASQDFIFNRFAAFAPMGVSSFPIEPYKCYGPYNYSYAEQSAHSHTFVKNVNGTIEAIPVNPFSAAGAPWHPGKRAHQLRADALAYYLLSILADAIDAVRTLSCKSTNSSLAKPNTTLMSDDSVSRDMNFNNNQNVHEDYRRQRHFRRRNSALQQWHELKSGLTTNESLHLRRQLSSSTSPQHLAVKDVQIALNLSFAQVNAQSVERFVQRVINHHLTSSSALTNYSGPHDDLNILYYTAMLYEFVSESLIDNYAEKNIASVPEVYDLPETNFVPHCYTDFEPRMANSLSSIAALDLSTWQRNLSHFDVKGVQKAIDNHWGYLDRKYVFYSVGLNSSLYLDLSVVHSSKIWLCELQKGFLKYPSNMADLNEGTNVFLHSSPVGHSPLVSIELDLLLDQCYRSAQVISPGKYILQLQQKTDKVVNLAYVLTW